MPDAPVTIEVDQQEVANLPRDFEDILSALEMVAMFEVEAYKGSTGVFASPIYYDGDADEKFTGLLGERRKATLKEKVWLIKYGVSYDLGPWHLGKDPDSPAVVLRPYAGGLYLHDDIELKVSPGVLDRGLDIDKTIEFNTPMLGLNTLWDLTKRWGLRLGGYYGGRDVDDVGESWEFVGTLAYHFKIRNVSSHVFGGYRYVHVDYEKSGLDIHVDIKGPLFGFGVDFYRS